MIMAPWKARSGIVAALTGLTILLFAGCGDDIPTEGEGTVDAGNVDPDTGKVDDDSGVTADAVVTQDAGPTTTDAKDDAAAPEDAGAPDAGPVCPGGAGCPCDGPEACYSEQCVDVAGQKLCAALCGEGCPKGQKCVKAKGQGSATVDICVPSWPGICDPCNDNKACQGLGGEKNACVDRGDAGGFCGTGCATTADCPGGYICEDALDIEGSNTKQCVLPKGDLCICSPSAIKQELSTVCLDQQPSGGKCIGKRRCLPEGAPGAPEGGGLTACDAPAPATEICDALDNDCDGKTDETTCDDSDPCTIDQCKGDGGCDHKADSGAPCDADNSVCTEGDVCKNGLCKPGTNKTCDDGNPCTADTCDDAKGCVFAPSSGAPCNADDNPCTAADACKDGACVAGAAKSCDSGDQCIVGKCGIKDGKCLYSDKVGTPCNDANLCTADEVCDKQSCLGKAINCNDDNACTTDSCDPKTGCKNEATQVGVCDDGNKCTNKDACAGGKCVGLALNATVDCDDGEACTKDICQSAKKGCENIPADGDACSDGNSCTENDACKAGKCVAGQNTCGCNSDKDCVAKEDGNPCNGTLFCDTGKPPFTCQIKPGSVVQCDDKLNSDCQTNSCNAQSGKCEIVQANDGSACDADGSLCSKNDTCTSGKCQPGKVANCDDGKLCTDDSCDPKKGCQHNPNTNPCNADDSDCTVSDACQQGTCVAGKKKNCDDSEPCTDDICQAQGGKCLHKHLVKGCDDSNKCTTDDKCGVDAITKLYTCIAGGVLTCNDKNPCTADKCDPVKGCQTTALPDGGQCNDGNACTSLDVCTGGKCVGKPADVKVKCDDGNPCTDDLCNPDKGCFSKAAASKGCDDGNACTKNDFCKDGKCLQGVNTCGCNANSDCASKEDGDLCNGTLFCDKSSQPFTCKINPGTVVKCDISVNTTCQSNNCDPKIGKCGIVKAQDKLPCNADNNVCTAGDACSNGVCTPGGLLDCNDKNLCTTDSCDPKAGCVNTPVAGPCEDGDACTFLDTCTGGNCKGKAVDEKVKCDDGNECTIDTCDKKSGCVNGALTGKKCDDGNACSIGESCNKGKCDGGTNVCGCKLDKDCAVKEDGNACNGTLFCDKSKQPFQCKIKPDSLVTCDTGTDNFCKKTSCDPKTGKCNAALKTDGTPCDADSSLCTTKDSCQGGKCAPGKPLPCDDLNPCTADSCHPSKACVHTAQGGPCDADGNACTVGDVCSNGKCLAGKQKSCNDGEFCTADSCNKSDGKCTNKQLVQSCTDNNACTAGDNCGIDPLLKKYTCVSGKSVTCNDANPCTIDACDKVKGCSNTVSTDLSAPCYSGPPKTRGKGECKDGFQKCQADGKLGKCIGSKLPSPELCDGKDNNCDTVTDEGCAPTGFTARIGNAVIAGPSKGKYGARAFVGGSSVAASVAPAPGGKIGSQFGFYAWLKQLLGK